MENKTPDASAPRSWRAVSLEVAFVFGLFFLYAGGPPPDVNETHYMTKAQYYWNPSECGDDLFLDSANPHAAFYALLGWGTLFSSLATVTWFGRVVTWALLAVGWQRLSWAVLPQRFASVATAALFLLLADRCHLAGEWAVGGLEAKSVAYVLVLFGLRSIVLAQWRAVWLWLGAASALHVLVGGWSVVAAVVCWSFGGKDRAPLSKIWPSVLLGACLALPGIVPAVTLSAGVDAAIANEANLIYVFKRLPHHLVFHKFSTLRLLSFGSLLVAWLGLWWYLRDRPQWRSLNRFTVAALLIAAVGVVIDVTTRAQPELAARLLKVYWYRLADIAVPLAVAMGIVAAILKLAQTRPTLARMAWTLALAAPGLWFGLRHVEMQIDFRPRGVSQSRPAGREDAERMRQRYRAWRSICAWIERQTPSDCRFLTPRNQQTFKWYAGRAELACWKDIPQDAESIVRWWKVLHEAYPPDVIRTGLGSWSDYELQQLAERHKIDYILVDRTRTNRSLGFQRVYPYTSTGNPFYELYRVYRSENAEEK